MFHQDCSVGPQAARLANNPVWRADRWADLCATHRPPFHPSAFQRGHETRQSHANRRAFRLYVRALSPQTKPQNDVGPLDSRQATGPVCA